MKDDPLFERADRAIAESVRLLDELYGHMRKAREFDSSLQYIHEVRAALGRPLSGPDEI